MFFAVFFVFYNIAMGYTTAARGALALSTLPLWTMVVAALLGAEPLTARKTLGVSHRGRRRRDRAARRPRGAPEGAWRGDLIMAGATLCMAFYNVWSRPFIARSSPLGFVTASMGAGALCLVVVAFFERRLRGHAVVFGTAQWIAVIYLGVFGGAAAFFLWVLALRMTTPTRVANTMTVNPIAASLLAAIIVSEPVGWNLVLGLIAVAAGIWLASTGEPQKNEQGQSPARMSSRSWAVNSTRLLIIVEAAAKFSRRRALSLPRLGPLSTKSTLDRAA